PPFQSQLHGANIRSSTDRAGLRERFGDLIGPYTDTAALFLAIAAERLARGGRACLVQPPSLLGSRDGAAIRRHLTRTARLRGLWVANAPVFDAAVEVCAPIFERTERTERSERSDRTQVKLFGGRTVTPSTERREPSEPTDARDSSWSALALPALGVPTP